MVKKQDRDDSGPRGIWSRFWGRLQARRQPTPHSPVVSLLPDHEIDLLKAAYLARLRDRLGKVYMYGLDERRHAWQSQGHLLDLEALYVPLYVLRPAWLPVSGPSTQSLVPFLQIAGQKRQLIVRGSPGSGHSACLKYLAFKMAQAMIGPGSNHWPPPEWTHGLLLPLVLPLEACMLAHKGTLPTADMLLDFLAGHFKLTREQFEAQIVAPGGLLWLVDNLDCAAPAVYELHRRFAGPGHVWIITAHEAAGRNDEVICPPEGFVELQAAPLTWEQIDTFVHQWYAELVRKGWIDQEEGRDLPGQIVAQLRRSDIEPIVKHRSLLQLVVLLHTLHGRLPPTRTWLYRQLFRLFLSCWVEGRADDERDLRSSLSLDRLGDAIAQMTCQLALDHPRVNQVELSENDLRIVLTGVCQEGQWAAVGELIARLLVRPTLIEERRRGVFVFAHPTLQDYVISRHLASQSELPRLSVRLARQAFHRWNEPITLAISRLAQLDDNLPAAMAVIDMLCPHPLPDPPPTDEQLWRSAWLAGRGLLEIKQGSAAQERPFPDLAKPALARVKGWLMATLEQGRLTPHERALVGQVLACLPGGDERVGVLAPEGVWCEVPAGPFWYGEGETAQSVELERFWMLRYPVTNAQYARFVEATGHKPPTHWSGGRPPDALLNHPVVNTSWHDALAYAQWLNERLRNRPIQVWQHGRIETLPAFPSGMTVRLPTNQEWEKAARGGMRIPSPDGSLADNPNPRRIYPWGDSWELSRTGQVGDETRCNVSESDIGTTTPVGMYPSGASPYGVLDMAGNVWEWGLDWADAERRYKVRRGGAFRYVHDQARCSAFDKAHPGLAWSYLGFRLVIGRPMPS